MGHMTYNPGRAAGADHFVLVYGAEGDEFLIHDPYGYPHVRLAASELLEAWRAETIGYKAKAFQYWHAPQKSSRPDEEQVRVAVWNFFWEMYAKIGGLKQGEVHCSAPRLSFISRTLWQPVVLPSRPRSF